MGVLKTIINLCIHIFLQHLKKAALFVRWMPEPSQKTVKTAIFHFSK